MTGDAKKSSEEASLGRCLLRRRWAMKNANSTSMKTTAATIIPMIAPALMELEDLAALLLESVSELPDWVAVLLSPLLLLAGLVVGLNTIVFSVPPLLVMIT
ncbi:hypothetical protein PC129_g24212 [Phytophthora cactorum]|uniref:Uncharacterized protein n=1 Tax=Phytophthora cactorum TaxID=29920 RepID=A0A8T1H0V4_9STRA|nr:hypothetical protein PC114_g27255 [Phytophthora cactorum]KAG2873288.1 hypothetical protein PC115_g24395 [Phytophthora cactorum]KAG2876532.1 hypothetical protein PC117_g27226 [Phytophthora cactorum]KAG3034227.1 hypothetical protein PC121_g24311 [Phytophthora cactorum]KAG3045825.1 hypothetical protein PC122_g24502 [Phytophthora cactorum]